MAGGKLPVISKGVIVERLTYFLITRKLFESAIWHENPHILKLFIYLIGMARHAKKPKIFPGFEVKRGELVTSLGDIADDNEFITHGKLKKWSRQRVSRMLEKLVIGGYIEKVSDTYGTHIKVCNYGVYQSPETYDSDSSVTGALRVRDGSVTGAVIYNNDKNVKNGKKVYIPENFKMDSAMIKYATEKGIDPEKVNELFKTFFDYHSDKKTKWTAWDRVWQTWVRNAPKFSTWAMKAPGPKSVSSKTKRNIEVLKGGVK